MKTFGVLMFGFAAIIVGVIIAEKMGKKSAKKIQQLSKDLNGIFSFDNGILRLSKQDERLGNLICLSPYTTNTYTDVPEQYVYTSATVGGVTTGGVHKTGGYTKSIEHSTGRYEIKIKQYDFITEKVIFYPIEKIYLKDDYLREEAKKHAVGKYVEENYLVIKEDDEISSTSAALWKYGNSMEAINSYNIDNINKYPTYKKCLDIVDFLCGSNKRSLAAREQYDKKDMLKQVRTLLAASLILAGIFFAILLLISLFAAGEVYWKIILSASGIFEAIIFPIMFIDAWKRDKQK